MANWYRTNSKATLRLPLKDLMPLTPAMLHEPLRESRHYAAKSDSLILHADSSRKQGDNVEDCFNKLQQLVVEAGRSVIRGETSIAQVNKVKNL